jgi:hypothetical protein
MVRERGPSGAVKALSQCPGRPLRPPLSPATACGATRRRRPRLSTISAWLLAVNGTRRAGSTTTRRGGGGDAAGRGGAFSYLLSRKHHWGHA